MSASGQERLEWSRKAACRLGAVGRRLGVETHCAGCCLWSSALVLQVKVTRGCPSCQSPSHLGPLSLVLSLPAALSPRLPAWPGYPVPVVLTPPPAAL